jgi:hypothetical protein
MAFGRDGCRRAVIPMQPAHGRRPDMGLVGNDPRAIHDTGLTGSRRRTIGIVTTMRGPWRHC